MSQFTSQNKVLLIYLHYGNLDCALLSDQPVNTEVVQNCVLHQCDVSDAQLRQQLIATLQQSPEMNAPIVPFPFPLGLNDFSRDSSVSVAERICNLLNRPLLSPGEFPRLYIIILVPILECSAAPIKNSHAGPSTAVSSQSSPPLLALTYAGSSSNCGTSAPSAASTSTSASPAPATFASAAPYFVGITGKKSRVHRSFRCCIHEVAASTITAVELVSKLQAAYNNYKPIYNSTFSYWNFNFFNSYDSVVTSQKIRTCCRTVYDMSQHCSLKYEANCIL